MCRPGRGWRMCVSSPMPTPNDRWVAGRFEPEMAVPDRLSHVSPGCPPLPPGGWGDDPVEPTDNGRIGRRSQCFRSASDFSPFQSEERGHSRCHQEARTPPHVSCGRPTGSGRCDYKPGAESVARCRARLQPPPARDPSDRLLFPDLA